MASVVVIDSGVLLGTVLQEKWTPKAKALLVQLEHQQVQLMAPILARYEVVSVMRKAVWQERLTADEGTEALTKLLNYSIEFRVDDMLLRRAYELATRFNRPTAYDSQYLALAERLDCPLWTADERLFNAVHNDLAWVQWVGHFTDAP